MRSAAIQVEMDEVSRRLDLLSFIVLVYLDIKIVPNLLFSSLLFSFPVALVVSVPLPITFCCHFLCATVHDVATIES